MTTIQTNRCPRVGDRMFEVGWCAGVPVDENGDSDMDGADDRVRRFETITAAREFARRVFPDDFFGSVSITPVVFEPYDEDHAAEYPHVGFWETCGETQYYEGPEENPNHDR